MLKDLNIPNIDALYSAMMKLLSPNFGQGEAREMTRLIFLDLKGWNTSQIITNGNLPVSDYLLEKVDNAISRVLRGEPVQYVTGKAHFHGLTFDVNPSVLIPRPETAQLVDLILDRHHESDLRILDIGTGSGCIAISLARSLPFSQVFAIDISGPALKTAQDNAERLKVRVNFINASIFNYDCKQLAPLNIIVSNPPYIDASEQAEMESNVLYHEPHSALFVPDDNPLVFYKRIAEVAKDCLADRGELFFEINPRHASELKDFLLQNNFTDIEIIKDFQGLDRFISCTLK